MQERFDILFEQYKLRSLTGTELDEFYWMIGNGAFDKDIKDYADEIYMAIGKGERLESLQEGAEERILGNVFSVQNDSRPNAKVKIVRKMFRLRSLAAAVAIMLISSAIWFMLRPQDANDRSQYLSRQDIAPGSVGATLTLSDGRTVALSDGLSQNIAEDAGFRISKDQDGTIVYKVKDDASSEHALNKLETAKGQTYAVVLPDGTKVWLNADSRLEYSPGLSKARHRLVKLSGEGYFEVAKDKKRPFIVSTAQQKVVVLGTHFNINAYPEEDEFKTTLLEGSVKVALNTLADNESTLYHKEIEKIILPGQQALVKDKREIKVSSVDTREVTAWKDGDFYFNEEKLSSIIKKLERWYDVEITLGEEIKNKELTGKIARDRNISSVLAMIEKTNHVQFKIEGRRIIAILK